MIVTGDVFTHTWDWARATVPDVTSTPASPQRMIAARGTMPEEVLRADGMFGPPIDGPHAVDDRTRFLAYVGRRA